MKRNSALQGLLVGVLGLSLVGNGVLAGVLIDQSVSLDGGNVFAKDCIEHRDALDAVMQRFAERRHVQQAGLTEDAFQFDENGRYIGSWYGASTTPRFDPQKSP